MLVAAGQLTKDSDKNREKDGKKGMYNVITPDKDQHDTMCAMYMFETYTHKHLKENIQVMESDSSTQQPKLLEEIKRGVFYTMVLSVRASPLHLGEEHIRCEQNK